jgi:hypothetical protein
VCAGGCRGKGYVMVVGVGWVLMYWSGVAGVCCVGGCWCGVDGCVLVQRVLGWCGRVYTV